MSDLNKKRPLSEGWEYKGSQLAQDGAQHVSHGNQNVARPVQQNNRPPAPPPTKGK